MDDHEPKDNKQNLEKEWKHNSNNNKINTDGINQTRSWEIHPIAKMLSYKNEKKEKAK